ncbi:uncharacterized protein LOC143910013 [Arctopsyche grandis]|uniref:uncharacterized protein LOC143910013 n=1 Tax=Arctopsyche grandis TaxID=121162 RepID=UPI00406D6BE2
MQQVIKTSEMDEEDESNSTIPPEAEDRLYIFVESVVTEIEATLTFHYDVLFGDLHKVGEVEKVLGEILGDVAKYLGLSAIKSLLTKFLSVPFKTHEKNKYYNYFDIVYYFNKHESEAREQFIKIAIEVFKSFEMQFMGVTGGDRTYHFDIKNLGTDAAQRFLNFTKQNDKNPPQTLNDLPAKKLEARNVVYGKSKEFFLEKFMLEIGTVKQNKKNIPCPKRKRPGFEIFYGREIWNTANLFEKSGVVNIDDDKIKLYARNQSKCAKYKFRRPFNEENWEQEYNIPVEDAEFKYDYTLDANFYERQKEIILRKINIRDGDFVQKRSLELIEELSTDLNDGFKSVKEELRQHHEDAINVLNEYIQNQQEKIGGKIDDLKNDTRDIKNDISDVKSHTGDIKHHLKDLTKMVSNNTNKANVEPKKKIKYGLLELVKFYTGREGELTLIHKALTDESAISQIAAITGLGGIGKSQLAVKYAMDYDDSYDGIIFINCENKENIETSSKALAKELGISVLEERYVKPKSSLQDLVQSIYNYIANMNILIILDNVETYSSIKDFLFSASRNKTISTLITSCDQNFWAGDKGAIKSIPLEVFADEEALDFAKKYVESANVEDLNELINTLGKLPLAMKQALGYIEERNRDNDLMGLEKFTVKKYLKMYENQSHMMLQQGQNLSNDVYNKTVATTWIITINTIKENRFYGELALKIFHIMAYLSLENILVHDMFSDLVEKDEIMWEAVKLLQKYSIIDLNKGIVNIHRLVQRVTRNHVKNVIKEEESILRQALELLNGSGFEDHAVSVWEYSSQYPKLVNDFFYISEYGSLKTYDPLSLLATHRNDYKAIESLLKSLNQDESLDFKTPLRSAAISGNVKVFDFIYKNVKQNFCEGALLYIAAVKGRVEVVKYLQNILIPSDFESEVEIFQKMCCILEHVSLIGHINIIEILKPRDNEIYLFYASLMNAFSKRNYDDCKSMIENAGENNRSLLDHKIGYYNITIIHIFCEHGNVEIVEILLKYFDVNTLDRKKETPIYCAASNGHDDLICFLMEKKANVSLTYNGKSLLHFAAIACKVNTLKMLIEKGLNCNQIDGNGEFPVHFTLFKNIDALKFFIEEGMEFESNENKIALLNDLITSYGINNTIKTLLDLGANINAVNKNGFSALLNASRDNEYEKVKTLLEEGADPNNFDSKNPQIPIHEAAKNNHLKIVNLLLKAGAESNELDKNGNTALHMATDNDGKLPVVELLVRYGCDIEAVNKYGKTPLDLAILNKKQGIIEFFNKQMYNKYGKTPLELAIAKKNKRIVEFFN